MRLRKMMLSSVLGGTMIMSLMMGCGQTSESNANVSEDGTGKIQLKVWVPETELELTKRFCQEFDENHPEYEIEYTFEAVENADSITQLKNDPEVAADVFVYPTGGVPEMIEAGLIYPITVNEDEIKSSYGENAIASCSADGVLYGIPQTPNSFFMYYNKSMYTEDEVKSLETMLAKDLGDGVKNFSCSINDSWYIESFFYANGGTLYGEDGTDPTECSWNDEKGYKVGEYLIDLVNNDKYVENIDDVATAMFKSGELGAMCSGTWISDDLKSALGDDLGATVLPTINIDGKDCQLSNFADFKAYGVKSSTQYPKAAQELAEWLGGEECQLARFQEIDMTPTATALLSNAEVQANVAAYALIDMTGNYSTPQPTTSQISQYWDPVAAFGMGVVNGDVTRSNLQESLDSMVEGLTSKLSE